MLLHGHMTVPMHLRYTHLLPSDLEDEVRNVLMEKRLREVRLVASYSPGQVIDQGIAQTVSVAQHLGMTLRRALKRRTYGLWGVFWAQALGQVGTVSPATPTAEFVITEETYHFTVAQYRYEALGLAVSEVALQQGTHGQYQPQVPSFLNREEIEGLVVKHLSAVRDYFGSPLGVRLLEKEVNDQQAFLQQLEEMLKPWWEPLGSIEQLVTSLTPGDVDDFQQ